MFELDGSWGPQERLIYAIPSAQSPLSYWQILISSS